MSVQTDGQVISIRRGEDAVIPLAPASPVDITGWSLAFSVSRAAGQALLAGFPMTTSAGIDVSDAEAGDLTVTIPAETTGLLSPGQVYQWDLWRTDVNTHWPLASGALMVREPVRRP